MKYKAFCGGKKLRFCSTCQKILLSIFVDEIHKMRSLRDSSRPVVYKETWCLRLKTDLTGRDD
jgi:hypothetical protein